MMSCYCNEPSLNEIMQEPIIRAIMERDAVRESNLRLLLERVRDQQWPSRSTHGTH